MYLTINDHFYDMNRFARLPEVYVPLNGESFETNLKKCHLQLFTSIAHNFINSESGTQEELRVLGIFSDFHFLGVPPDFSSLWGHRHCLSTSGIPGLLPHRQWARGTGPGM